MRSGETFTQENSLSKQRLESQGEYRKVEHRTIEDTRTNDLMSSKDEVHSEYRKSSHSQNLLRTKIAQQKKNFNFGGRSADVTSTSTNTKTNSSQFPSLGKKMTTQATNKIL